MCPDIFSENETFCGSILVLNDPQCKLVILGRVVSNPLGVKY